MKKYQPLPYRWHPLGTTAVTVPEVGQIIAWHHEAWRVVEVQVRPEADWSDEDHAFIARHKPEWQWKAMPRVIVARPVCITGDDPRVRDHDVHLSRPPGSIADFDVYKNDHYPVCAQCGEPLPCREEMARRLADAAARSANCYSLPGVCPACQEPVTGRQKAVTWEENLRVPLGPPVTFHAGRRDCRYAAMEYEQEWAKASPGRVTTLSCPGHVRMHVDGPECSEGDACLGFSDMPHKRVNYCDHSKCLHCRDALAMRSGSLAARNAAGDWTVWE